MSDEEKIEEETYSLIFSSLKHPIRRKILRMLAREPRTFSEILEAVSIDSGHLNYHLENLGDLITHSPDGKYGLSSIGVAAVKLMSGVEEHPPVAIPLKSRRRAVLNILTKIAVIILIVALTASSLFFINFTKSELHNESTGWGWFVTILPNQTVEVNITVVCNPRAPYAWSHFGGRNLSLLEERPPFINTVTEWEKGWYRFTYEFNSSYMTNVKWYDALGMLREEAPVGGSAPIGVSPGRTSFGGWVPITQPGMYITEIENIGSEPITGNIILGVYWERFERPYFHWGIVGLLIAFTYPTLTLIKQLYLRIK